MPRYSCLFYGLSGSIFEHVKFIYRSWSMDDENRHSVFFRKRNKINSYANMRLMSEHLRLKSKCFDLKIVI